MNKGVHMDLRDTIRNSLEIDRRRLLHYEKIANTTADGRLNCKWDKTKNKHKYYYKSPNDKKEHYIAEKPNTTVWKIQRKRFANAMIGVIKRNMAAKEAALQKLTSDLESDILTTLPKAYRPNEKFRPENAGKKSERAVRQSENPYKRERLVLKTSFGLYVRSKGEMIIAELLYSLGIEFYYEKALTLKGYRYAKSKVNGEIYVQEVIEKTIYPDFTIVLPNGRVVYWEHEGMLSDWDYAARNSQKIVLYNQNRIYQPYNLIITSEGPNNEMDVEGIRKIISGLLLS